MPSIVAPRRITLEEFVRFVIKRPLACASFIVVAGLAVGLTMALTAPVATQCTGTYTLTNMDSWG